MADRQEAETSPDRPETRPGEMAPLIRRLQSFTERRADLARSGPAPFDAESLRNRFGYTGRKGGRTEIILSEDVAVELGHPSTASRSVVLTTFDPECVRGGRVTIVGPDLDDMDPDRRQPLGQAVILALKPDSVPDPFEMENAQFLMNRLPGFMVRSVPGKLWVRISKTARAAGMTLSAVGSALVASYTEAFPGVDKVEVVFISSAPADVEELGRIAAEAAILAGRHKKLVLGIDGEVECMELNCEACDDKPVCDDLRDIVIKRRGDSPR